MADFDIEEWKKKHQLKGRRMISEDEWDDILELYKLQGKTASEIWESYDFEKRPVKRTFEKYFRAAGLAPQNEEPSINSSSADFNPLVQAKPGGEVGKKKKRIYAGERIESRHVSVFWGFLWVLIIFVLFSR